MITLFGVHHADPDKRERLLRAFEKEKPSCITVESTEREADQHASAIRAYLEEVRRRVAIGMLNKDIAAIYTRFYEECGFQEVLTPQAYGLSHNIPVCFIDHPNSSVPIGDFALNNIPAENINPQYLQLVRQDVQENYQSIRLLFQKERAPQRQMALDSVRHALHTDTHDLRDKYPAKILKELARKLKGNIIHVCGYVHTLEDDKKETLMSLFGRQKIKRALLCDY